MHSPHSATRARRLVRVLIGLLFLFLGVCLPVRAADLATAPPEELLRVYSQLRSLRGSGQQAVTENVEWKRDAATFTFVNGRLTFAEPVAGRVLAAVFEGQGKVVISPPGPIEQRQIARFTKSPKLEDEFREAVFFFTDDSWAEIQKLVKVSSGGDAQAAGKALGSAQEKYSGNFNEWWENETKGSLPMRNLPARMLADLSDPSSRGFFLADFKGERSGNLLYHISWNRDALVLPDFSNDEEVMLLHYKRGEYFEWWAGYHLAEEYAHSPRPEHRTLLAHCRQEHIEAEVGKDNRLSATAELEFEVPAGSPRVLPFRLEGVLRISSLTDDAGKKVSFIQEDRKLDSDPWLILPEPAVAGRAYKVKIAYDEDSTHDSRIVHQMGSGLYFVTARTSWYPSFGAFDDRTQFTLHFASPKKFQFIATGRRLSSEKSGDSIESEWQSEIPYSVVGFNYGDFVAKTQSDADFAVTAYAGKEVPDELKGVQTAMDMDTFSRGPGASHMSTSGIMEGGFNTAANAKYAAAESYQAFKLYEFYFGSLPFKTVSVTEQPVGFFGQSWPTLIFLPYLSLLDATTRHSLRLGDSAEDREFFNTVAVHEMSHQWWGHMVGWKTYHDQWLSEGFADFSAALYLKQFEPTKLRSYWDLKRKHLLSSNRGGHRPVDVGPLWLNYQANKFLEEQNSTVLIYEKGAYVLEMLRAIMEDPRQKNPDAPFISMMRDFVSTYAAKNASTEDFRRIVEKHLGQSMEWFFDEWVYGTEIPHYELSYQLKPGDGGKTLLQATVTQSGVSDQFLMRVPIYIYVNGQPRRLGLVSVKGSNTTNGNIPLPFRPEKVTLDEYHSILATE